MKRQRDRINLRNSKESLYISPTRSQQVIDGSPASCKFSKGGFEHPSLRETLDFDKQRYRNPRRNSMQGATILSGRSVCLICNTHEIMVTKTIELHTWSSSSANITACVNAFTIGIDVSLFRILAMSFAWCASRTDRLN